MFKKNDAKKPPACSIFKILFRDFAKNPLTISQFLLKNYGEIVKMPGFYKLYLISCPKAAGHILQDNYENFVKTDIVYTGLLDVIGRGILTEPEHNIWWPMRQTLNQVFYSKYLIQHIPQIIPHIEKMCDNWAKYADSGKAFDIHHELTSLTATTAISLFFGNEYLYIKDALLRFTKIGNLYASGIYHLVKWLPLPHHVTYFLAKRRLINLINKMIKQHKQLTEPPNNFLTVLLQAKDPVTNQPYTQQRIIDEIITIGLTGHETISNISSWAFYSIARNSEIAHRLQKEYATVLNGRIPTMQDLTKLDYTRMVIEETMRCFPVIWTVNRKVKKADIIEGYLIPKGSTVAVSIYNIHYNKKYWEQPSLFYPERFTIDKIRQRERFAFIPFGAGPRICIGSHYAMMEAFLILSIVLQKYEIKLVNNKPIDVEPLITLRPAKKVNVMIKHR